MFNDNILPLLGSTFGTSPLSSEWIVVSIPHAGGHSMTYLPWAPEWVKSFQRLGCSVSTYAYVLPGRDGRRELKCDQSILGAAHELITHIKNLAPKKLLIYGHSMGALIAYESARGLIDRYYQKLPTAICVSGMGAPGYPNHNKTELSRLEDAELVEALLDIGQGRGASQKDIIKAFLPRIRQDICAVDNYQHNESYNCKGERDNGQLLFPLYAWSGDEDKRVTLESTIQWGRGTLSEFNYSILPGGHFFINEHIPSITDSVASWVIKSTKL